MAGAVARRPRMGWTSRPPEVGVVGGGALGVALGRAAVFTMRPGEGGGKRTGPDRG